MREERVVSRTICETVAGLLVCLTVLLPGPVHSQDGKPSSPPGAEQKPAEEKQTEAPVADNVAYSKLVRGSLYLEGSRHGAGSWSGTGGLIDADRRLALTNYHVVSHEDQPAEVLFAWFPVVEDGEVIHDIDHYLRKVDQIPVRVVFSDARRDIALVQLEKLPSTAQALNMSSRSPRAGEDLHALAGLPRGSRGLFIYTQGTSRAIYDRKIASGGTIKVLETQMPLNQGNSGGAIVNDSGDLVGVFEGLMVEPGIQLVNMCIDRSEVLGFLNEALPLAEASSVDDLLKRAGNHALAHRYDPATADYNAVLKLDPQNARALAGRGWVYYEKDDHETARADFDESLEHDSHCVRAYWGRGMVHALNGEYDTARSDLTQALRFAEGDADRSKLLTARGNVLFDSEEYAEALADYERALERDGRLVEALRNKGSTLTQLGRYEDALNTFKTAADLAPQDAEVFNLAGHVWYSKEDYQSAANMYSLAIERKPKEPQYHCNRGMALRQLGKHEAAINDLAAAVTMDEKNADFINELGLAVYDDSQYRRAAELFRQASEIDDSNPTYFRNLGDALHLDDQHEDAVAAFTKGLKLAPDDAELYDLRGTARDAVGDSDEANEDFGKAIELDSQTYRREYTRFLTVHNATQENLDVFLQYYTKGNDGKFYWYPGVPSSGKNVEYEFVPGETAQLSHNGFKIKASRMRLWAKNSDGSRVWNGDLNTDIILAPDNGYISKDGPQKYTFTFE